MSSAHSINLINKDGGSSVGASQKNFMKSWSQNLSVETTGFGQNQLSPIGSMGLQETYGTIYSQSNLDTWEGYILKKRLSREISEDESRLLALIQVYKMPKQGIVETVESLLAIRKFYESAQLFATKTRTPDLHPGLWMSDDFDDPLPDEFWFGEDQ